MINPLAPYMLYVKIAVVALVVGALWMQHGRIQSLKEKNVNLQRDLVAYQDAQVVNLQNVGALTKRIADMVDARALEADVMAKAVDDARAAEDAANKTLAATEKELNDAYAKSPTARAWGSTGVDSRVADRLPGQARRN